MMKRFSLETIKFNSSSPMPNGGLFATALVLLFCSMSFGDTTWTGSVSNSWGVSQNWDNGSPVAGEYVNIPFGTVNFTSGTTPNVRGIRQTGGTLNFTDGTIDATELASATSNFDGTVTQSGGSARINAIRLGTTSNANSSYTLSGGSLNISRARNNTSLLIGATGGATANMTVSGGSFATRSRVILGNAAGSGTGIFTVLGSTASTIRIGGSNDDIDGVWHQYPGSSIVARFDVGGVTPIFIHDNSNPTTVPPAVLESGSLLDVDHLSGDAGGTWTVLEVENADIIDNGLQFAPGVDTSVWSFSIDNSGTNGRLLVTATGDPGGFPLVVGTTKQQQMRFGMDYERLWFWTSSLNAAERDAVAKWSVIDTRIDYIRVAMNGGYELEEGVFNLSAYTNKIIPMMQEMKDANPDIKFFASPRPLNEAFPNDVFPGVSKNDVRWQPYPFWVSGASSPTSGSFNFNWQKCAEYLERYLVLMDSYGFKISFMDLSNEWQTNSSNGAGASSRINQADAREITEYLKASTVLSNANIEVPLFIAPSAWNYSQGSSWISNLNSTSKRAAVDIAACHNTDRTGSAQQFADAVRNRLGADTEIWNTEVHGWKSTSSENETTSFYYMLEKIRAGFSGLNGWLAIGTTNQGHAYILNPNGTPVRNVKYFIFKKLSETSNYGHALDMFAEPSQLSHTAALIKGNLMTVWVINQGTSSVPVIITPAGREISESTVKRTRWTDPSAVQGFVSHEPVTSSADFYSSIPGESVCCFEVLLEPEDHPYTIIQAEDETAFNGMREEQSGDTDGTLNFGFISNNDWARYDDISLFEDSAMRFRVARPSGRRDGWVEVYLGSPGESTLSILTGKPVGKVAVPETGNWQTYVTIEAPLEHSEGDYDVVLRFAEVGSTTGDSLFNFNWLSVESSVSSFLLGDVNLDGTVDFADIPHFITLLISGVYQDEADCNQDGIMDFSDIPAFIAILIGQ